MRCCAACRELGLARSGGRRGTYREACCSDPGQAAGAPSKLTTHDARDTAIQAAFRWGHSHLHEFIAGDGERYGAPDPMYDDAGSVTSESTRLTTALRKATLNYVYDFGDYWEHRIKVEKTLAPDPLLPLPLPFCVGGACAPPPEDCGGPPGYDEFVRAMADPDDSEHDNLAEWIGAETWDPTALDTIEVNDRLGEIKL